MVKIVSKIILINLNLKFYSQENVFTMFKPEKLNDQNLQNADHRLPVRSGESRAAHCAVAPESCPSCP